MKFYFIYRERNEENEIVSMGISPKYDTKEEMYLNAEFVERMGYEVKYKIA